MSDHSDSSEKTSRRKFTMSAITALAMTPIASATTWEDDLQDKQKPKGDGSPITVGGGGGGGETGTKTRSMFPVYVLFYKYQDYPTLDQGDKKKKVFKFHQPKPVKTLIVTINGREYNLSAWIPDDGKGCSLQIRGKGGDWHLDVYIDHAGVKFHTGKYPPELGNEHQCNAGEQCDDEGNYINRITFKTPMPPKKFEWDNLRSTDVVKVYIDVE